MSPKLWSPPPSAPLIFFLFLLFLYIYIYIYDKKNWLIDLPDTCTKNNISYDMYSLYSYGSPDKNRVTQIFTLQKNGFNKNIIQGMLNMFYILSD